MSAPAPRPAPGSCFKFTVRSAEEAVALIREKFGANARVLSVRSVEAKGLRKFFGAPRLEVIAQMDGAPEAPAPSLPEVVAKRSSTTEVSAEPALPDVVSDRATPRFN